MKVSKGQLRNGHIIVFENKLSGLTLLYLTFDNARSVWLSRLYIRYRTREVRIATEEARRSDLEDRIASRRGHHYVGAPTPSA
jgi:hypothetical protein